MAITLRDLHAHAPGRILTDELAGLAPADEMAERVKPIAGDVRRHGVDEGDNEFLWQGCQTLVAVRLAEALENGAAQDLRAAGEAAEGLRAVVLGDRRRDRSRPAALAGTDRDRGCGERALVGFHELGRADDPGELDIGRAAAAEVVIPAVALHVLEMELGHRSFVFFFVFSFSISSCHSRAPAAV